MMCEKLLKCSVVTAAAERCLHVSLQMTHSHFPVVKLMIIVTTCAVVIVERSVVKYVADIFHHVFLLIEGEA